MQQIQLDKSGFATPKTPVSSGGMLRFAKSVEEHLNDLLNGVLPFDRELFAAATELTISSGQITTTQRIHTVKAESGTADDLTSITSDNNKSILLKAKSGHSIAIRHGVGNITVPGGVSVGLSGNVMAKLWCADNQWCVTGYFHPKVNNSATVDPGSSDDASAGYSLNSLWINTTLDRAWVCVDSTLGTAVWKWISPPRNGFSARTANSTLVGVGIANQSMATLVGTTNLADNTYTVLTTGTSIGDSASFVTNTFNLLRLDHSPVIEVYVRSVNLLTSVRCWIGIASAAPTNVDTIAAGTKFVGFRFSSVAGDAGWTPVVNDGSNQTNGTTIGTMNTSTGYKLRIRVDAANAKAYFSVDGGAEQAISTNFPAITTEMGIVGYIFTQTTAARTFGLSSFEVGW